MLKIVRNLTHTGLMAMVLSGCSNDPAAITELCTAQNKSFEHCSCFVAILEESLSEEHLAVLADMARYQMDDGLDEAGARKALIAKYGRVPVVKFLAKFIGPQVEAELSCPA